MSETTDAVNALIVEAATWTGEPRPAEHDIIPAAPFIDLIDRLASALAEVVLPLADHDAKLTARVRADTLIAVMTPHIASREDENGDFVMLAGEVIDRKNFHPYSVRERPLLIDTLRTIPNEGASE